MEARIRKIKIDTVKTTRNWEDSFVRCMSYDGVMTFEPLYQNGKRIYGWYKGANFMNYHISWLKDIQE